MKSGEEALKNYSFGAKRILHKFCGSCGSSIYFDPRMEEFGEAPPDLLGVNVSLLRFQGVLNVLKANVRGACVGSYVSGGEDWGIRYCEC
jgi:hypothetical protein